MRFRLTLALLSLAVIAPSLGAQGLFVDVDRPGQPPSTRPSIQAPCLPMTKLDFNVVAREAQVELTVMQTFANRTNRVLEGVYLFPLPAGAVAADFALWMNGEPVDAEVLNKDKARGVYESIVRRARDPGLLEYIDQDLLRARIFPIEPGKEAKVRAKVVWTAQRVGSLFACDLPLHVPEGNPALTLQVDLSSTQKLGPLFSPTHQLDVLRDGDHQAKGSFEGIAGGEQRRVRLYYGYGGEEPGVSMLAHRSRGSGHFLMTLFSPSPEGQPRLPRDVVFVLDRSGSMKDGKLEQAVKSLEHGVATLGAEDRFDVVSFATGTRSVFGGFVEASQENKDRARQALVELKASGGTALAESLLEALSRPFQADRLAMVVLLTDGEPTIGETNPDRICAQAGERNTAGVRVFCFGLGHDVNARLLDTLANAHHGVSDYVLPDEDLELRVSAFFDRVREPVLRDVEISITGVEAHDVFPREIGDLYAGSAIHLLGQYDLHGKGTVTLKGKTATGDWERSVELDFPKECSENESLRPLFASRKVAYLLQEVQRNGLKPELKEEIERLGREYGIVTPWTSALVVEDGEALALRAGGRASFWSGEPEGDAAAGRADRGGFAGPGSPPGVTRLGTGHVTLEDAATTTKARLQKLGEVSAGEKAVEASVELNRMAGNAAGVGGGLFGARSKEAGKRRRSPGLGAKVAHREGRTFLQIGEAWVDRSLTAEGWEKRETITAYSKEYFALIKAQPAMVKILSLGEEVVVQVGEQVYHVLPEAAEEAAEGVKKKEEIEKGDLLPGRPAAARSQRAE